MGRQILRLFSLTIKRKGIKSAGTIRKVNDRISSTNMSDQKALTTMDRINKLKSVVMITIIALIGKEEVILVELSFIVYCIQ